MSNNRTQETEDEMLFSQEASQATPTPKEDPHRKREAPDFQAHGSGSNNEAPMKRQRKDNSSNNNNSNRKNRSS